MKEPVVIIRKSRESELEAQGVTGAALECLLRETTEERHLSRAFYARWAAEEYYLAAVKLERDEVSIETLRLAAGAILWSDVIGIGGKDGVEGSATTRHPAFANCGKGRKYASDGDAWSAAIHTAALNCAGCFRVNTNGVLVYSRCARDAPVNEIMIDETIMPVAWVRSILREGLRRAAGVWNIIKIDWENGSNISVLGWHQVPFEAPRESLPAWANAYNKISPND